MPERPRFVPEEERGPQKGSESSSQDKEDAERKKRDHELHDLDYVDRIMVGDDAALHTELREFLFRNGMTEADIERSFEARRLRQGTLEGMRAEKQRRLVENPAPTDEELSMGVYQEDIEPQVREAVREMRRKGWSTRGSGFDAFDKQVMYLDAERPDLSSLSEDVRDRLKGLGVTVDKRGTILRFSPKDISLEAMTAEWDAIASALPDLGMRPLDHEPAYLEFARNAKKYRGSSSDSGPEHEKSEPALSVQLIRSPDGLNAVEILGVTEGVREAVRALLAKDRVDDPDYVLRSKVSPYLQQDNGNRLMIEFWNGKDKGAVLDYFLRIKETAEGAK